MTLTSSSELVGIEVSGGLATITLNRPAARNAFNLEMKQAVARLLQEIPHRGDIRAVLLTGADDAFCAGGDVKELDASRSADAVVARHGWLLRSVYEPLTRLPVPTVAAVNGLCFGAGVSLMLSCDIAVAREDSLFSLAFSRMGLVPDCGALWLLPRAIGLGRAKELLYTARRFDASAALELGLVQRVLPKEGFVAQTAALAAELAAGPVRTLAMTKQLIEQASTCTYAEALVLEVNALGVAMTSPEHAEALLAFSEKRAPDFPAVAASSPFS